MNEILMFHRVLPGHLIDKNDPYYLRGTLISTARFESVLLEYLNNGYSFLTISDLAKSDTEKNISLTFDDGYADNFTYALPVLEKYNLKGTFYPIIKYCLTQDSAPLDHYYQYIKNNIRSVNYYDWINGKIKQEFLALSVKEQQKYIANLCVLMREPDVQYMSCNQLKSLCEIGHEIGAHSYQHDIYTFLSNKEIQYDIELTLKCFQSIGISPISFAYPDGRYNKQIIIHLQNAGFQSACAVKSLNNKQYSPFALERKFVTEHEII